MREINEIENTCLDMIEESLEEDITSYELINSENIYDDDIDIVYRGYTFNRGNEDYKIVDINQEYEKELLISLKEVQDLVDKNQFSYEELIAYLTSDMVGSKKSLKKELKSKKETKKEIKKKNG